MPDTCNSICSICGRGGCCLSCRYHKNVIKAKNSSGSNKKPEYTITVTCSLSNTERSFEKNKPAFPDGNFCFSWNWGVPS